MLPVAREEGVLVGFSSGAALKARLKRLQPAQHPVVVTVFADSGERYMNSRFWEEMVNYFEKYWRTYDQLKSPRLQAP